jgi:membrane protease YdiL (CAAX protease family)
MPLPLLAESLAASPLLPWITGILFLLMIVFYGWLAVRISPRATLVTQPFGIADALTAGVLALWMISVIWNSFDAPKTITLQAIIANSVVYGTLVMGICGVIGFQRRSAAEMFGLSPSLFPKAAVTGLLWLVVTYPLIAAAQTVIREVDGVGDDSQMIVRYFLEHPDLKHRAAVILMAVVVAPVAEEVLFRGYFYGVIRRFGGRIPALLTSSLIFAAIHVHLPSMPGLLLLAISLCLLYEHTGSLWGPITMHAAFNASTIAALIFFPELAG